MYLEASSITLEVESSLAATGGPGGGISTMPVWHPEFSCGADGGMGYVRIQGGQIDLQGTIDAVVILPCECDLNHDDRCDMQHWLLFGEDWGRTDCPIP